MLATVNTGKNWERFGKNAGEWTGRVEIRKEEIPGGNNNNNKTNKTNQPLHSQYTNKQQQQQKKNRKKKNERKKESLLNCGASVTHQWW